MNNALFCSNQLEWLLSILKNNLKAKKNENYEPNHSHNLQVDMTTEHQMHNSLLAQEWRLCPRLDLGSRARSSKSLLLGQSSYTELFSRKFDSFLRFQNSQTMIFYHLWFPIKIFLHVRFFNTNCA